MSSAVRAALKNRSRHWEAEPADLELNGVDLEAAADAQSLLIDARDNFVYTVWADVTDTAATTGDFSLFLDLYARDGTTLIEAVELYRLQSANGSNQVKLQWGEGITARLVGVATIGVEIASLKLIQLCRLRVVKDVVADGASVLSVRMQFGD